jgi:hypothetical protein
MKKRPYILCLFALGALAAAGVASAKAVIPHKLVAVSGQTHASVVYFPWPSDFGKQLPKITIVRRDHTQLTEHVAAAPGARKPYRAIPYALEKAPLRVRDLDGDGEPEVLLDLYWGGTRCCMWTRVYRFDALASRYRVTISFWGNFQDFYRLRDLDHDGRPEFVSHDRRIESISATWSYSSPIRIFSYRGGRLLDVTRHYPLQIKRDAASLRGRGRWTRELLAAWVADEYLLGHRTLAQRELHRALRLGELRKPRFWNAPKPQVYIARLYRFLRRAGYA